MTPELETLMERLRPAVPPARPMKIFFWSASEADGTWIYRCKMPMDELNRLGHEVHGGTQIGPWARDEADIIVGQRVCMQGPSALWQTMCRHRTATGQGGMVYEVDDDLFDINAKVNPMGRLFLNPTVRQNMIDNIRAAHACTVSTAPLRDVLLRHRGGREPVAVLPNAVRSETLGITRQRPPARATMYGWQGSDTHAEDWEVCRAAVVAVLSEDFRHVRLRFLGGPQSIEGIVGGPKVDAMGWTTDIHEHYQRVADFDVTLAPLANTKFNRSKSALRVQESLALGVPVVASDVPSYRGWVGGGGLLVRPSTAAWVDALRAMQDPARRADMAAAGREAAQFWTIERTIGERIDFYQSLLAS
jgi:hypothetical protein